MKYKYKQCMWGHYFVSPISFVTFCHYLDVCVNGYGVGYILYSK